MTDSPPAPTGGAALVRALSNAQALANRLHADEVSVEHLLAAILEDEGLAATRLVLHAFADPQTLRLEALALSEGVMVVRSRGVLPFSVRALRALQRAGAAAEEEGRAEVVPTDLLRGSWAELPAAVRERTAGLASPWPPAPRDPGARGRDAVFRALTSEARRVLGRAAGQAAALERTAIAPAHLLMGVLETVPALRERTGWTSARLHLALAGQDADATPIPIRDVPHTGSLTRLLGDLPSGSGTTEVLAWILKHGSNELRSLLNRQQVDLPLVSRAGRRFRDPD